MGLTEVHEIENNTKCFDCGDVSAQWRIHRRTGGRVSPDFRPGDSHAKVPPLFDTQCCNSQFYKLKSRLTGLCV